MASSQSHRTADTLPRLILHFDVNSTIVVADAAAGRGFDQGLNKALKQSDWLGSSVFINNSSSCSSNSSSNSTESTIFTVHQREDMTAELLLRKKNDVELALKWEDGAVIDEDLCHDGQHHFIAPSFFKTLAELTREGRRFTVIIRTFGKDVTDVARAINAFASGRHPRPSCRHPQCDELALPQSRMYTGRYRVDPSDEETVGNVRKASFNLRPFNEEDHHQHHQQQEEKQERIEGSGEIADEEAVVHTLELREVERGTVTCMDDYPWWKSNSYSPSAGKPLWITEEDSAVHHIFFDDNIHNCSHDSIVAVRWRERFGDSYRTLSGENIRKCHGLHTVRVQSCDAYVDEDYFLKRIAECEREWAQRDLLYSHLKRT